MSVEKIRGELKQMTLMSFALGTFDNKRVMAQVLECCQWHLELQEFADLLEQQEETFPDFCHQSSEN